MGNPRVFDDGLIVSLVCATLLLAGCGPSALATRERAERTTPLYRKAFAAEQSGEIKEAVRLFNRVLVCEPRSFSAHFQLATLLQDHEEDYIGAIHHYRRYLELCPETEKKSVALDRIRIAEQLLAPQILRKVGDSVQGLSAAHLLKENERLNHLITTLEGDKSLLQEERTGLEKECEKLASDNERLRNLIAKLRIADDTAPSRATGRVAPAETPESAPRESAKLRALREEAAALSQRGSDKTRSSKKSLDDDALMRRVRERIASSDPQTQPEPVPPPSVKTPGKEGKEGLSAYSIFMRERKKDTSPTPGKEPRIYVVQPGDTLFRVAEKFYGSSTQWKRIRDANPDSINLDGRIRAGQNILIP